MAFYNYRPLCWLWKYKSTAASSLSGRYNSMFMQTRMMSKKSYSVHNNSVKFDARFSKTVKWIVVCIRKATSLRIRLWRVSISCTSLYCMYRSYKLRDTLKIFDITWFTEITKYSCSTDYYDFIEINWMIDGY